MGKSYHRDEVNWDSFIPQKTEDRELELNNIALSTGECRGCKTDLTILKGYSGKRVWCQRCLDHRRNVFKSIGRDHNLWVSLVYRKCHNCKESIVSHPLHSRVVTCSDECLKIYTKQRYYDYWKNNREKHLQLTREYYIKNKEHLYKKHREWASNNPEKIRNARHRRRVKLKDNNKCINKKHLKIPIPTIEELYKKQKGICALTNLPMDLKNHRLEVDHIVPIDRGGVHMYTNVQLVYALANHIKSARLESELSVDDYRRIRFYVLEEIL